MLQGFTAWPIRPFARVMSYSGGAHKAISGSFSIFNQNVEKNVGALNLHSTLTNQRNVYVRQNSETANIQNIILWFFVYVSAVAFFCICVFPLCFVCYSYIRIFWILYDYINRCTKYIIVITSYGQCTRPTVCRHAKIVVAIFFVNLINIQYIIFFS